MQVSEVFRSIQGEGVTMGRSAVFIRFAGCNLKCKWCDTSYAWAAGSNEPMEEVFRMIYNLHKDGDMIIFTGGEPMIQDERELKELCYLIQAYLNCEIVIETNGLILPSPELFNLIDHFSVSPKLKSATDTEFPLYTLKQWEGLAKKGNIQLKFVIQDADDFSEFTELVTHTTAPENFQWVLQPEYSRAKEIYEMLPKWVDKFTPFLRGRIRYLPQIHKIMNFK